MKTAGNLLKEARIYRGLSVKDLEELTHIKSSFIEAIEKSSWDNLPEESTVVGFVKSISHFLNIDERQAVALFRREYPSARIKVQEKQKNSPVKNVEKKFYWGPRFTFLIGIILVILTVLGYLGFQYRKFNLPPNLIIDKPTEGQTVSTGSLQVTGSTDVDATLEVNNQSVIVEDNGKFAATIDVSTNTNKVEVRAESRSGKVTTISRTIIVKP